MTQTEDWEGQLGDEEQVLVRGNRVGEGGKDMSELFLFCHLHPHPTPNTQYHVARHSARHQHIRLITSSNLITTL